MSSPDPEKPDVSQPSREDVPTNGPSEEAEESGLERCPTSPPTYRTSNDEDLERRADLGRAIYTHSDAPSCRKLPLKNRAGLFARLSFLYEAEEPKLYPRSVKWYITFIIALAGLAAPMGSAIILRTQ